MRNGREEVHVSGLVIFRAGTGIMTRGDGLQNFYVTGDVQAGDHSPTVVDIRAEVVRS